MRLTIEGVEGECVDCLCVKMDIHSPAFEELSKYEGGEVVTADEHDALQAENAALTAQLAAIEGELEAACADQCADCGRKEGITRLDNNSPDVHRWRHSLMRVCRASLIRERQFQRRQEQSGE